MDWTTLDCSGTFYFRSPLERTASHSFLRVLPGLVRLLRFPLYGQAERLRLGNPVRQRRRWAARADVVSALLPDVPGAAPVAQEQAASRAVIPSRDRFDDGLRGLLLRHAAGGRAARPGAGLAGHWRCARAGPRCVPGDWSSNVESCSRTCACCWKCSTAWWTRATASS